MIELVLESDRDWGTVYVDGKPTYSGHEAECMERALDAAGVPILDGKQLEDYGPVVKL